MRFSEPSAGPLSWIPMTRRVTALGDPLPCGWLPRSPIPRHSFHCEVTLCLQTGLLNMTWEDPRTLSPSLSFLNTPASPDSMHQRTNTLFDPPSSRWSALASPSRLYRQESDPKCYATLLVPVKGPVPVFCIAKFEVGVCPCLHHNIMGTGNHPVLCQLFLMKSSSSISSRASPTECFSLPDLYQVQLMWPSLNFWNREDGIQSITFSRSLCKDTHLTQFSYPPDLLHILYLLEEYECPKTISHNHFPSKLANS